MSKRKYCDKDLDMLDRLKKENKQLKRQLSNLKKQLDRINPSNIEELREFASRQEERNRRQEKKAKLADKWKCYNCGKGNLYIIKVPHPKGTYYFRSCDSCDNRTKAKPYTSKVKGLCKTNNSEQE